MKKVEKPKNPLIFYYLIALIILLLLNTFLFPNILGKNKVNEVDYGPFLTMVEGKDVSKVELNVDT
ncbi:ATP-dependent metallopeptidase FtsH/Yme1/Tma family protein, partial [Mediterraneibacter faecis]|uniref:ATP-dependent metallopeptidase FtsH/Yme1/Tma family protein n=1 Tax=Mediterraneibacter faecis TaxID=592978 RepID=UPI002108A845